VHVDAVFCVFVPLVAIGGQDLLLGLLRQAVRRGLGAALVDVQEGVGGQGDDVRVARLQAALLLGGQLGVETLGPLGLGQSPDDVGVGHVLRRRISVIPAYPSPEEGTRLRASSLRSHQPALREPHATARALPKRVGYRSQPTVSPSPLEG